MNRKLLGMALLACAGSMATLAAAGAENHFKPSTARAPAKVLLPRQALSVPLSEAEQADPALSKLDAMLNRLRLDAANPAHAAAAAVSLNKQSGMRLRTDTPRTTPSVLVDFTVRGNAEAVKAQLLRLDARKISVFSNVVSAWLPTERIADAAALPNVRLMRASLARTNTGSITTQGDFIQRSFQARATLGRPGRINGGDITVGILSDSFNCRFGYAADKTTGDLPIGIQVLGEEGTTGDSDDGRCKGASRGEDEGRAMAQIIHDVAPGAKLAFRTAFDGEADFAAGIIELADAGAKVIVDDIGYFDEPVFQDGIIGQAVDQVAATGVSYFSAAGNSARQAWEGEWVDSGTVGTTLGVYGNRGQKLMQFTGKDGTKLNYLPLSYFPDVYTLYVTLQWDQPYITGAPDSGGATSSMNICETDASGKVITEPFTRVDGTVIDRAVCSGVSKLGGDAYAIVGFDTPGTEVGGLAVSFKKSKDSDSLPPNLIRIGFIDDGETQATENFATLSGTIQGHPQALGASAVAATYFRANPICLPQIYPHYELEPYSSAGGTATLFAADGTRLETPVIRNKPNITAPDGGANTFFLGGIGKRDSDIAFCSNPADASNFFGTSAAAPHAAGVAALLMQAQPLATPQQIRDALQNSASDDIGRSIGVNDDGSDNISTPAGFDFDAGYGLVQADAALDEVLPSAKLAPQNTVFGAQVVGTTSAPKKVKLTNTDETWPLEISAITTPLAFPLVSGDDDCPISPDTLAPGASCIIQVAFHTSAEGDFTGLLRVASNASRGLTANLSGSAFFSAITVSPTRLDFQQFGQTASGLTDPQSVNVTSSGGGALGSIAAAVSGEFAIVSNDCPATLDAGASCTIGVAMSTTSLDKLHKRGLLTISSDAQGSKNFNVVLTGDLHPRKGGSMPMWLLIPGLAAFAARRRKLH